MSSPVTASARKRETQDLEGFLNAEWDFGFTVATIAAVATVHQGRHLLKDSGAEVEIVARCVQLEQLVATL